jgi:stage IV sporulation protein FB
MIRISKSFVFVVLLMVISGHGKLLAVLFLSVTLHEAAHVLAAQCFGRRVTALYLTALGEMAVIRGLESLAAWKRGCVYIAGPLANLLIAAAAYALGWRDGALYNAVLGLFNLLPVLPLDGGRLVQLYLGNQIGILRANRVLLKMGRAVGLLLLIPGGVQAVLFPYNISLICAGVLLRRLNIKMSVPLTFDFFSFITHKKVNRVLKIKHICAPPDSSLQTIVEHMGWDNWLKVRVGEREACEPEIVACVLEYGLHASMAECFCKD